MRLSVAITAIIRRTAFQLWMKVIPFRMNISTCPHRQGAANVRYTTQSVSMEKDTCAHSA
ncbi:hypothetical protein C7425_1191 [Pantoea ananatis]|nr:hypothetical protein C7427_1249 [Pantoea ananatis]PWV58995.1 hypothetical protein C7425_1191 [Pantoea ananatis]PWV83417.1 hypothetical protein C7426_1181 [Pantoea ananatis]REC88821.1 hypothetical protein C7423_1201 [Pantoea ananatis]